METSLGEESDTGVLVSWPPAGLPALCPKFLAPSGSWESLSSRGGEGQGSGIAQHLRERLGLEGSLCLAPQRAWGSLCWDWKGRGGGGLGPGRGETKREVDAVRRNRGAERDGKQNQERPETGKDR